MGCTITCKEDGVFIDAPLALQEEVMTLMMNELEPVVYWLRIVSQEGRNQLSRDWESATRLRDVEEWLLSNDIDLEKVELTLHCTVYYDETGQDFEYSAKVHRDYTAKRTLMTTNLWIGKEGAAVEVELAAEERELMKHREGLTPHISMAVSKEHSAGELGKNYYPIEMCPGTKRKG